jgi:FMN phosphatase YigB (HAD superfamily)
MAVKAVLFDVGETLVNEGPLWAEYGRFVGVEPHVISAAYGATIARGESHARVWELLGVDPPARRPVGWEAAELYPDALPCLHRLRERGLWVGLAGNIGTAIEPVLERFGIEVDYAVASHTLGVEKPEPEFFARLLESADRLPAETAYVGDRIDNDVIPAAEAGMCAIHIRRGPWGYLQRGAERAHAQIHSLDELPEAFAGV